MGEQERPLKVYLSSFGRLIVTDEFITRNRFKMPTQDEAAARFTAVEEEDFLGFKTSVIWDFLDADHLLPFCKEGADLSEVKAVTDLTEAVQDFADYMYFAWDKATDERGISASRSIDKLGEYLWLLGRQDLAEKIHDDRLYNPFGAPALIAICDDLGIEVPIDVRIFAERQV